MSGKKVYFVRHGETEGNLGQYYQTSETPLTEAGHQGAQAVAERFTHIDINIIIASPFMRAQQTAAHISKALDIPVITSEYFHEVKNAVHIRGVRFGTEEAEKYNTERTANFLNPKWCPEGAENYFDVSKRIECGIKILEENEYENIVVVSHGHFLRSFIARLLLDKHDEPKTNRIISESLITMSNVGITEFVYKEDKWRLFTWNDHAHFAE